MRSACLVISLGLLFTLTACSDDTGSSSTPTPSTDTVAQGTPDSLAAGDQGSGPSPDCGVDCNGALANNPTASCQVYDASYASGNVSCTPDCQVDVSQCVGAGPAPTLSPEFGECLDATQCEAGLECVGAAAGASGLCGTPCAGEGDASCGAGRECLALTAGGGICFNQDALRDQACLGNGSTCAEGQGECVAVAFDAMGNPTETRCKLQCDGPDIGAQGTCPANETCMTNPVGYINLQEDGAGNPVTCTTVGEQDVCGAGYTCYQTAGGQTVCAQAQGWCGDIVPLCGDLSGGGQNCGTCGAADDHAYCSVQGATGEPAATECFKPEGGAIGICLGYCETDDGTDLDCGAGYECAIPPVEETIYVVPQGGEQQVPCTDDTACDAAGGFTCMELSAGSTVCARPLKMCRVAAP